MAELGIVLVPTLDFLHHVAESGAWTPELERQGQANVDHAQRTLDAAVVAGVTVAVGSDGVTADGVAREIARLVEHGLATSTALAAATAGGAAALGIDSLVGSLRPGMVADLFAVGGDPLDDPTLLARPDRITFVVHNGRVVRGSSAVGVGALHAAGAGPGPAPV